MKPIAGNRRLPRETQPLALQAIHPRFVALYGNEMPDETAAFIKKLLDGRSFRPEIIDASELTATQAVAKVATHLGPEGHLLLCVHGINIGKPHHPLHGRHYMDLREDGLPSLPTESLIRMVVDQLGVQPNRINRPGRGLPFLYLFSCHAGALRHQILPGSDLWRRANLLIFASTRTTNVISSGNSITGAIAYVDYCQRHLQEVDPMKLLFFAGIHRGDCVTLMGGKLDAPLVWHAPKSGEDQQRIDNLSGTPEDKRRFEEAIRSLRQEEWRLLPAASLTEVLCNRILRKDADHLGKMLAAHPTLRDAPSALGFPPVVIAAELHASQCLRLLLEVGADPDAQMPDGGTALMESVRYEDCQIDDVISLLEYGATADTPDTRGRTALMFACRGRHTDAIQNLLNYDADPNAREKDGYTALMYSAEENHGEAAQLLISQGADPDHQTEDGSTALIAACTLGHSDAVLTLLKGNANPDIQDNQGYTALMLACEAGYTPIVRTLLEFNANPDLQDENGWTALRYALELDDTAELELLLVAGARLDLLANDGSSCLSTAATENWLDALDILLAAGASPIAGLDQALVESTRKLGHHAAADLLQQALDQSSTPHKN